VSFSVEKEALVPHPKVAAGARTVHPMIQQLLSEFRELTWPSLAAPQPLHGMVHHIIANGRPVLAKALCLEEFAALEKAGIVSHSMSQ
jgi:hypothetical protein